MKGTTCLVIHVSALAVMFHPICHTLIILQDYVQPASTTALLVIMLLSAKLVHPIIFYILIQLVNFLVLQVLGILTAHKGLLNYVAIVFLTAFSASMQVVHAHAVTTQPSFKMAFALADALVIVSIN